MKSFVISALFAAANGQSTCPDCSGVADSLCLIRSAEVTVPDPSSFGDTITFDATDSACESASLPALFGADAACQTIDETVQFDYFYSCSARGSLKVGIDFSVDFSSADDQVCDDTSINTELGEVFNEIVQCTLTSEVAYYISCLGDDSVTVDTTIDDTTGCPNEISTTTADYASCACNKMYDLKGAEGYAFTQDVSQWVQQYMNLYPSLGLGSCTAFSEIDCEGLVEACDVNDDPYLVDCTDVTTGDDDDDTPTVSYIYARAQMCLEEVPKSIKRSDLWDWLKSGISAEFQAEGVTVEFDAYLRKYNARRSDDANSKVDPDVLSDVNATLACENGQGLMAGVLSIEYEEFDDLIDMIEAFWNIGEDAFSDRVLAALYTLAAADLAIVNGGLEITAFQLDLTLYDDEGNVWSLSVDGDDDIDDTATSAVKRTSGMLAVFLAVFGLLLMRA